MMSLCDIIRVSHAVKREGTIKGELNQTLGCYYYHLGVLVQDIWVH